MIPLAMILVAAVPDAPQKPKPIFSGDDYPAQAAAKGEQGEVVADLLVNPAGGVETCSVVLSSSFRDLDQATCALLMRRAEFVPGKDDAGRAVYDVVRTPPITWSLGSFSSFPVGPDYDLIINRAPDGVRLPLDLDVEYLVTRDGRSQNCRLAPDRSAPAELVALACQTVSSAPANVIRDHNGLPVEAQNHAYFRFSLDKAKRK